MVHFKFLKLIIFSYLTDHEMCRCNYLCKILYYNLKTCFKIIKLDDLLLDVQVLVSTNNMTIT